jgi:hypothetical protein
LFFPMAAISLRATFFANGFGMEAAGMIAGRILLGKIVVNSIVVQNIVMAKIGRGGRAKFSGRSSEVRENGLLLNLAFPQSSKIVGHSLFFVEADLPGVGAHETFVEHAAGELVEVFVFEGAQHAAADFSGVGDGVEREPALLALFAKFFSKRSQRLAPARG